MIANEALISVAPTFKNPEDVKKIFWIITLSYCIQNWYKRIRLYFNYILNIFEA